MSDHIDLESFKNDYDWQHAFVEAVEGGYRSLWDDDRGPIEDVVRVIAAVEGENEGDDWVCVVEMKDGRFAALAAGCDYTGWSCQAGGTVSYASTEGAAIAELTPEQANRLGLPHSAN